MRPRQPCGASPARYAAAPLKHLACQDVTLTADATTRRAHAEQLSKQLTLLLELWDTYDAARQEVARAQRRTSWTSRRPCRTIWTVGLLTTRSSSRPHATPWGRHVHGCVNSSVPPLNCPLNTAIAATAFG